MAGRKGISRRQFVVSAASTATAAVMPARGVASATAWTKLTPYLLFDGTCREAMEFYKSCLGGQLTVTLVKDSPAKSQMQEFQQQKVLNAHLTIDNLELSASDWLAVNETPVRGTAVCVFLRGGTFQALKAAFDKLAQGADVTNPLKEVYFGAYGALNDKFGVRWMFQTDKQDA